MRLASLEQKTVKNDGKKYYGIREAKASLFRKKDLADGRSRW